MGCQRISQHDNIEQIVCILLYKLLFQLIRIQLILNMHRQRLSKISIRSIESSQSSKQSTLSISKSKAQLVKGKHTLSKFRLQNRRPSAMKQRNNQLQNNCYPDHTWKYIYGNTQCELQAITKHLKLIHQGLIYSSLVLGSPTEEYLKKRMVSLPQNSDTNSSEGKHNKFLMLDLDQTLIHSVEDYQPCQVQLEAKGDKIRMNVRPFCNRFLQLMSQHFHIYVFTSSLEEYAGPIVNYLNNQKKTIQGILTREHCLQTRSGLKIKDLRIIKNRDLSKIVIVDNLVHSFGLQIQNGIPILQFTNHKQDKQLLGLQKLLLELKNSQDVREFLRDRLQLKKCLQIPEDEFLKVKPRKSFVIKKRTTLY